MGRPTLASTLHLRLSVAIERRVAIVQERGDPHIVLDEDVGRVFRHELAEVWISSTSNEARSAPRV